MVERGAGELEESRGVFYITAGASILARVTTSPDLRGAATLHSPQRRPPPQEAERQLILITDVHCARTLTKEDQAKGSEERSEGWGLCGLERVAACSRWRTF